MKLKHLYMLGAVALMTASCNEDRFLDLKPQGFGECSVCSFVWSRGTELECMVSSYFQLDLW